MHARSHSEPTHIKPFNGSFAAIEFLEGLFFAAFHTVLQKRIALPSAECKCRWGSTVNSVGVNVLECCCFLDFVCHLFFVSVCFQ